jgi:DNA-binding MarR family transcriptional regulator
MKRDKTISEQTIEVERQRKRKLKEITTGDKIANLWWMLRRTTHVILKAREKELGPLGISAVKAGVLALVKATDDNITPAEISRQLLRDAHSVSELLSRMEQENLIKKVNDLPRKNQVRVVLTKKGQDILSHSTKRISIHEVFSTLSATERRQLMTILKKVRIQALKQIK